MLLLQAPQNLALILLLPTSLQILVERAPLFLQPCRPLCSELSCSPFCLPVLSSSQEDLLPFGSDSFIF